MVCPSVRMTVYARMMPWKQTLRARYVEKWIPPRPEFRFCGQYLLLRLCEVWFQTNIEHENT